MITVAIIYKLQLGLIEVIVYYYSPLPLHSSLVPLTD